jgi:hypothetical protein
MIGSMDVVLKILFKIWLCGVRTAEEHIRTHKQICVRHSEAYARALAGDDLRYGNVVALYGEAERQANEARDIPDLEYNPEVKEYLSTDVHMSREVDLV